MTQDSLDGQHVQEASPLHDSILCSLTKSDTFEFKLREESDERQLDLEHKLLVAGSEMIESSFVSDSIRHLESLTLSEKECRSFLENPNSEPVYSTVTLAQPTPNALSEVIAITTSLGSIRRQFFSSRRTKNFLDCKGLCYFLIDANRDVSEGANLKDSMLLKNWSARGLLSVDQNQSENEKTSFSIPQVLIDGVPIGNEVALQDLEDDGDLEYILVRSSCPSCLAQREATYTQCPQCGVQFLELISPELVAQQSVQRMCCGQLYWD